MVYMLMRCIYEIRMMIPLLHNSLKNVHISLWNFLVLCSKAMWFTALILLTLLPAKIYVSCEKNVERQIHSQAYVDLDYVFIIWPDDFEAFRYFDWNRLFEMVIFCYFFQEVWKYAQTV